MQCDFMPTKLGATKQNGIEVCPKTQGIVVMTLIFLLAVPVDARQVLPNSTALVVIFNHNLG